MKIPRCDMSRVWTRLPAQLTVFIVIFCLECTRHVLSWQANFVPNSRLLVDDRDVEMRRFLGNTSSSDDFHIFLIDGDSLVVGARNYVYNISLLTLSENKRITWYPPYYTVKDCLNKRKPMSQCHNFIRVLLLPKPDTLVICGTNAYDPRCRTYRNEDSKYELKKQERGTGWCPYDPTMNTSVTQVGGTMYSATYADFTSRDSIIFSGTIRTEQYNSLWLNEPSFVNSFDYGDKVYFFFRETAVEHINCGKVTFSRVARVCKNDKGGARVLRETFTSFFKARLNCSIPGEFPFYFNEIQSTSELGKGNIGSTQHSSQSRDMIYGIFTTPDNSITGSAVCAYRMMDIIRAFEGTFKEQLTGNSNWLPADKIRIPVPHPGQCVNDTHQIQDQTLNFLKSRVMMDDAVPTLGGRPLLMQTSFNARFTKIAIDWQFQAVNDAFYDIMFVGTDDGRVVKAITKGSDTHFDTVVIEEIHVFESKSAIVGLKVYRNAAIGQEKLVVIAKDEIRSIPLHRCHLYRSCRSCVGLQDPYCSWTKNSCENSLKGLQNVVTGHHDRCPDEEKHEGANTDHTVFETVTPSTAPCEICNPCRCEDKTDSSGNKIDGPNPDDKNTTGPIEESSTKNPAHSVTTPMSNIIPVIDGPRSSISNEEEMVFSLTTFVISVGSATVVSMLVGIIVGYCARCCACGGGGHSERTNREVPYMDTKSSNKGDIERDQPPRMNHYENYLAPSPQQQKPLNVLLNVKPSTAKTQNSGMDTKGCHKVKKVYV